MASTLQGKTARERKSSFFPALMVVTVLTIMAGTDLAADNSKLKSPVLKPSTKKGQKKYTYTATLVNAIKPRKNVQAAGITWNCSTGRTCTATGPWPKPGVSSCNALAREVGAIKSYGYPGKDLTATLLKQCNKGVKTIVTPKIIPPVNKPKKPQTKIFPPLSQTELNNVARSLNKVGSQNYRYVELKSNLKSKRKIRITREESVEGIVLYRNTATMKVLGGGFYDDLFGNLVYEGYLRYKGGRRSRYSITSTSWGETIFGIDRNIDGVTDVILGYDKLERHLWMLSLEHWKRLLECLEEAGLPSGGSDMFSAASLCISCLDPNMDPGDVLSRMETGCVRRGRSGGGVSGGVGTVAQGLFEEPNCGPEKPRGGIALDGSQPSSGVARVTIIEIDSSSGEVESIRRSETTHYPDGSMVTIESQDRVQGRRIGDIIEERYDTPDGGTIVVQTNEQGQTKVFHEGESSASQPAIGPDGMPEGGNIDPRCDNSTAMAQGSVWGKYCRNKDGSHIGMINCVRKLADSIYAVTSGRCWKEPSPAGGEHIVCRQEGSRRGDGSEGDPGGGVSPGGEGSGENDDLRKGTRSSIAERYIDTTPMGAFLIGLCARGGCPDQPPTDH